MELKVLSTRKNASKIICFNRTFMELKEFADLGKQPIVSF